MENTLHRIVTMDDPALRVVRCPDCGQLEYWSEDETNDHGLCRTIGADCPVCGEQSPTT